MQEAREPSGQAVMLIGDVLVAQGLVTQDDIEAALQRQRTHGGILGDHLIALGSVSAEDLSRVVQSCPASPRGLDDTGLSLGDLLNLTVKAIHSGAQTPSAISDIIKIPPRIVQALLEEAQERKLLDVLGSTGTLAISELRYTLTEKGKQWAYDALSQNQYLGPAPVPLAAYVERIQLQRITNERVDRAAIEKTFGSMVVSQAFVQQIGPAINSGRSILLYGPPGNGKTSVAEKIGDIFCDTIYIPYCFEVEGETIKVFDPSVHIPIERSGNRSGKGSLRREDYDQRWVPCRRPFIVAGGELTLEMLDLRFNAPAGFTKRRYT